jgi:serine/threonine-protein kinase
MSPKKLLKRPLENAEELDQLAAWVAERRARFLSRTRTLAIVLTLAAIVLTLSRGPVELLIPMLLAAVVWTPTAVRRLWTQPRILSAQRRLLQHRGLADGEGVELLGDEIRRLVRRIRKRLAALGGDEAGLIEAERRAQRLLERLAEGEEGATTAFRERLRSEQSRLRARLEAFRVALVDVEVEALLRPEGKAGETVSQTAIGRAAELLDSGDVVPEVEAPGHDAPPPRQLLALQAHPASIAVLPFADLSPERDQEYFCHGLAEELINALTQIPDLRVIARASSFLFPGERHDVREIGRALGVERLVEGSVRKAGDRLRVTVQLVSAADGHHLWSERYDRDAGDVFAVQDEITAALVAQLSPAVWDEAPRRRREVDLEAYHLHLKARHRWNRRTPTELKASAELFEQAIARDPEFALAHAGLADAFALLGFYSVLAPHEAFPKAITAASQALEIDAGLAEAHASLAFCTLLYQWDFAGAEASFRRALELNPGYATAHHWLAEFLGLMGRDQEALEQARIAHDLDPLSPVIHTLLGWLHYYGRRFDDAIAALERTLEVEADFPPAEFWLGLARLECGRTAAAAEALEGAVAHSRRSTMMLAALGRLKAIAGDAEGARALLAELETLAGSRYVPPYYCAAIHCGLGEVDATFDCLDKAYDARDNWLVFLAVDPLWDDVRTDARFGELLRKVGLRSPEGGMT